MRQLGSLGSGNHFIEVQVVDEGTTRPSRRGSGCTWVESTLMIHTGSRGLGHQVCTDF